MKIFLPTAEHSADFIQKEDERAVASMVKDFMFPTYLQKKLHEV